MATSRSAVDLGWVYCGERRVAGDGRGLGGRWWSSCGLRSLNCGGSCGRTAETPRSRPRRTRRSSSPGRSRCETRVGPHRVGSPGIRGSTLVQVAERRDTAEQAGSLRWPWCRSCGRTGGGCGVTAAVRPACDDRRLTEHQLIARRCARGATQDRDPTAAEISAASSRVSPQDPDRSSTERHANPDSPAAAVVPPHAPG